MLRLYGIVSSRASRNMWMLNELGLDYEHVPVNDHNGESRRPEYLKINPNGKVPLLVDGDYKIFESIAINLHLSNKYGDELWFDDIDLQGQAMQWSIWGLMEADENIMHVLMAENESQAQREFENLERAAKVINKHLSQHEFLVGDKFSCADLNTAACFSGGAFMPYNFSEFPHLFRWLNNCYARPAANIEGSSLQRFYVLLKAG